MKHFLAAACLSFALMACSDTASEGPDTPSAEATGGLSVTDAFAYRPLQGRTQSAGFFTMVNGGGDDAVIAASSPSAEAVELHTHTMNDGVMQMRQVERVALPAGETVTFEPGGLHLMIFGVSLDEGQDALPVLLTLESGTTVELTLPLQDY